ncbi:hypothetical protein BAUCODRAFT_124846 [Baudoinia panamericana UAMH 10762]|uniref:Uncharacterized protein n=1 Tax=Baudoinia panamericana (strain UAMH 10762) TaxID=717646 RepID=M2MRL8_BAUPA|nr:uncharacterized protein BAUCODRAFT_124846 [Baudoinia panamericana UAMH 10762]EMC94118.1 hypothetical protein BAUCODRAFT_124846 [Baudoinia panamericana UAMH 10762]
MSVLDPDSELYKLVAENGSSRDEGCVDAWVRDHWKQLRTLERMRAKAAVTHVHGLETPAAEQNRSLLPEQKYSLKQKRTGACILETLSRTAGW